MKNQQKMYSMQKSYSFKEEKFKSTIKRSQTTSSVEANRCFKPTDRFDPSKKSFLVDLSKKMWNKMDGGEGKKPIDLQKIFTPANDVDEIKPGTNRKLFASSSFYSPAIHPTVEDQVELARRISHSLSDISNQQSKGQSMYVNRKKRSVKWIHDDDGQEERYVEEHHSTKENGFETSSQHIEHSTSAIPPEEPKKVPLKLVMDPRHVQDFNSMRQFGYEQIAPMSPEFGLELCNALNSSNEKGAELFAKRRKKAEKWVVDGSKQQQQATTPTAGTQFLPAFSEAGIQRVQHNMKLDQIQEKYINQHPSIQMVRSPWEAALETGNVDNAFVTSNQQSNQQQQQMYQSSIIDYGSTASPSSSLYSSNKKETQYQSSKQFSGRDLAYKPSVPQGWNREIKLQSETDEIALENEMQEIYEAQKSYMELIRDFTPTPPLVEYEVKCGDVETNVYEEPIKELMVECDTRESTPEYQTVPVKALINNFEQGKSKSHTFALVFYC
ncbi:hypothetical protein PVAND_003205 [Polypedilum vanderplanki]|uniref:Uncharacterized protein n=1 Tax=Polypedilum vanderplanki TaxID=319348 RepID=A0A9J6BUA0_POLVA|nr:hypothetical protein PVAND_003205 [Polypedilum vanderplanki]